MARCLTCCRERAHAGEGAVGGRKIVFVRGHGGGQAGYIAFGTLQLAVVKSRQRVSRKDGGGAQREH